ncbi:MAG: hypothetical protein HYZ26_13185 [Chloroflexi bacterium]|nr:hypothetical protein [Chloroflexota bacterium]
MPLPNGSRCFYAPEYDLTPEAMRRLVSNLPGVKLLGTLDCDEQGLCWFEFEIDSWRFKVHNPFPRGAYWFIAADPQTDEAVLARFVADLEALVAVW